MKTIGLIGGITAESTVMYYRALNKMAQTKYGGLNSAKVIINSVNFEEIKQYQIKEDWKSLDVIMSKASKSLENAGASCILICANTMHLCFDAVRKSVSVPIIHIVEATAKQIQQKGIKKVALLGTKHTMEKAFYTDILTSFGIETIVPNAEDRDKIHDTIHEELSKGILNKTSKENYLSIIKRQIDNGAEGVILGCTEIPLLIHQDDVTIPVFDTTTIHATEAFNFSINK